MKRLLLIIISCIVAATVSPQLHAAITFSGATAAPVAVTPDASTGLEAVYVLPSTLGVKAEYAASSPSSTVRWQRYSSLGGGYAEDVPSTRIGNVSSITLTADDMGYIVEEGTTRTYFWVVNYANHPCELRQLTLSPEQDCATATLLFSGSAERIVYYSITGVGKTLSRDIIVEYRTLTFDSETNQFVPTDVSRSFEYLSSELHLDAPLCATDFMMTGDRFQIAWGGGKTIESPTLTPHAVEAVTSATQTSRNISNEQRNADASSGALGGSAPVEITFEATVTDGVVYHEWQYAFDPAFNEIDMRVNLLESTHVFTEYGTVYVRFVCGDNDGLCDWTSETYTVNIGESKLECPNAFSPGSSEGTNDEWKVSYKSIVSFDCHIFNRWGVEVAHLTDPSQGWDGRHNGKLVKSGVFYYVIEAEGADGKKYKLSGDINIIHMTRQVN